MADEARIKQKETLAKAIDLLRAGDADGFSVNLAASHIYDGMTHAMQRKWPQMDDDLINEAVSTAVAALYQKVLDGGVVTSPAAYLWKAAFNTLATVRDRQKQEEPLDEQMAAPDAQPGSVHHRDHARAEAVRLARSFLPNLGRSEGLRKVMAFIIDAAEAGEFSVENEQIAAATGLTAESVRRLKSRGFQRLRARAQEAGIELDDYMSVGDEEEPDDEENDE